MAGSDEERWITTAEAAQRLGVKAATVYAYVSRGLLVSRRNPHGRGSLLDRAEVDRLASGGRRGRLDQRRVHRFRSVTSQVSHSGPDALYYRGYEVADWSRGRSAEDGIELVLGARPDLRAEAAAVDLPHEVTLDRRCTGALVRLAEQGWGVTTDPEQAAAQVAAAYPVLVDALAVDTMPDRSGALAARVVTNLAGRAATPKEVRAMDELLIQLLDHGLTASTTAARAAASARAGIADCLLAGYGALAGHAHGRASERLHPLLSGRPPGSGSWSGTPDGLPPGFGHFMYADGDPRADVALAAWAQVPAAVPALAALEELRAALPAGGRHAPNIDAALAVATCALGAPPAAGTALFVLARTAGLAAHAAEEYAEDLLRWRGRAATRALGPPG